ncbi:MAG: hypothetical protein JSV56_10330 [Methanomassiliicoccales archaeon]|nr:MAG: hypothetical protein JSV56_10330 [Methanomassiliicoccales archaeon]
MRKKLVVALICIMLTATSMTFAASSLADWEPADGHKMHWPQTPDISQNGVAVRMPLTAIRADDFKCTQTGYITGIHIWGSFEKDILPASGPTGLLFTLSIWSNIPPLAPGTPGYNYSMPGTKLWDMVFPPGSYTVLNVPGNISEGWYDPEAPFYAPNDHHTVYQFNFEISVPDAYYQHVNTIYWLGVQHYLTTPGTFGWKSTDPSLQWNDNAVRYTAAGWAPLEYPSDHDYAGQPLDFAFVINGTVIPTMPIPPWHFTPHTLNLASKGRWISAHVTPPVGREAADIDQKSVMVTDSNPLPAIWARVAGSKLLLKFDRGDLEDILSPGEYSLLMTGQLVDGTQFMGYSNTITFTGLE